MLAAIVRNRAIFGTCVKELSSSDTMKLRLTQAVGMINMADIHKASKIWTVSIRRNLDFMV